MVFKWLSGLFPRFQVIVFRLTTGRAIAAMRGMPILLLTTVGRKTGKQRTTPLVYIRDGEKYVVTASNNGRDTDPAWYRNLLANPDVAIEIPGQRIRARAAVASPAEHEKFWANLVARAPFFEGYRKGTSRAIPMVLLAPR